MNKQYDINISKIDLVVYRDDLPENEYTCYNNGRNVCGLVAALGGKAVYTFKDGTEKEISAGEAALFSDRAAYIVKNSQNEPFEHYTVNFSLASASCFNSDVLIKPVNFNYFAESCAKLYSFWRSGEPTAHLRCISVLYELLAEVLENKLIETVGYNSYKTVLPAVHYMNSHYNENITLEMLARLCMMSVTNFRRVFTAVCGTSPIQYLISVRIKRAGELLTQSAYSVSEIAHMCGFGDVEFFCRTFKKKTGKTATQTRSGLSPQSETVPCVK